MQDMTEKPVSVSYGPTAALGVSPECGTSSHAMHETCDVNGCSCHCHGWPLRALAEQAPKSKSSIDEKEIG